MLDVINATFSYGGPHNVFQDISFSVSAKEVLCLLGPNGTGKSTLIKCLDQLLPLKSGSIVLNGRKISSLSRHEIAKKIAYIPQSHVPTFPFPVLNVVLMGRTPHMGFWSSPSKKDIGIAEESLHSLGILHLQSKPYTEISGGERQLVLLAAVLTQEPDILLLDEPTSHLDFGNQVRLLEIINRLSRQGMAVIMSSHFPDHAFLTASTVAIMQDGRFIEIGSPDRVITASNIRKTYGIEVAIGHVVGYKDSITCVPIVNSFNKVEHRDFGADSLL